MGTHLCKRKYVWPFLHISADVLIKYAKNNNYSKNPQYPARRKLISLARVSCMPTKFTYLSVNRYHNIRNLYRNGQGVFGFYKCSGYYLRSFFSIFISFFSASAFSFIFVFFSRLYENDCLENIETRTSIG